MSGKKGMTWTKKTEPGVKMNTQLKINFADKVKNLAETRRWSISATLAYIVEEYFKNA